MDGSEVEDEIDIEFGDSIPACAFDLEFATKTGDGVSGYAVMPQVVENKVVTLPACRAREPGHRRRAAERRRVRRLRRRHLGERPLGRVHQQRDGPDRAAPTSNGHSDVFLRDRCVADGVAVAGCTPATTRESTNAGGEEFHDGAAGRVGVSDDGRFVAYSVLRNDDPNPPITQSS